MAEYIERSAAVKAVLRERSPANSVAQNRKLSIIQRDLLTIPAADVAPVVHGRWISYLDGDHIMPERYYRCSRCGRVESRRQPYCHCGAKMDGGECDASL